MEFLDFTDSLRVLREWGLRDGAFPIAVVGGAGGSGKSRIGAELCRRLRHDWRGQGEAAVHLGFVEQAPTDSQWRALLEQPDRSLVVVDYAEDRPEEVQGIARAILGSEEGERARTRFLFVVRRPGWGIDNERWLNALPFDFTVDVRDRIEVICDLDQAPPPAMSFPPEENRGGWRSVLLSRGVEEFQRRPGATDPGTFWDHLGPIDTWDVSTLARPLDVVVAAYLATYLPQDLRESLRRVEHLYASVILHELRYRRGDAERLGCALEDEDLLRLAALATLTDTSPPKPKQLLSSDAEGLIAICQGLTAGSLGATVRIDRLQADRQDPGSDTYWQGMVPDSVGEFLVAAALCPEMAVRTDLGPRIGIGLPVAVLPTILDFRRGATLLAQPLVVLSRILARYPSARNALSEPLAALLEPLIALAIDLAGQANPPRAVGPFILALTALVREVAQTLPAETLGKWANSGRSNYLLFDLSVALSEQLLMRLLAEAGVEDPAAALDHAALAARKELEPAQVEGDALLLAAATPRAELLRLAGQSAALVRAMGDYAAKLSEVGRGREGLAWDELVVQLAEDLAAADEANLPILAAAVTNLGISSWEEGQPNRALHWLRESVKLNEELAAKNPDDYRADVASAYSNLASLLSEFGGDRAAALGAIQRSLRIRGDLVDEDFATYASDYAQALENAANILSESGRRDVALEYGSHALEIRKILAKGSVEFRPALATSMMNMSGMLAEAGQFRKAKKLSRKAVKLWRKLAAVSLQAFGADLAMALNNYSNVLLETDNPTHEDVQHGLALIKESVSIYRQAERVRPGAHRSQLAMALTNLACRYGDDDRLQEALDADDESVKLYTALARQTPAHIPHLCTALNNQSAHLSRVGRNDEALESARESCRMASALHADDPVGYAEDMATAQLNLANRLNERGSHAEAMAAADQAVRVLVAAALADSADMWLVSLIRAASSYVRIASEGDRPVLLERLVDALGQLSPGWSAQLIAEVTWTLGERSWEEMVPEFLRAARRLCEQETDKKATRMAECAIHEYTEFLSVKGAATEQEPGDQ